MASKIKYENVKEDIENQGWTLLSNSYTNLKTDLQVICPEKHECLVSYEKWRKGKFECPICKQNQYYKTDDIAIKKKGYRILVFDQASITSGWAVFDNEELINYGSHTSNGENSTEKIAKTKYWVASMIENWKPDEIVIEDIQLQKGTNSENFSADVGVTTYKKLAHLQGVLKNYLFETGIPYTVVSPSTWRAHSEIKGKERTDRKRNAQLKIKSLYDVQVTQDEADAILIGRWAVHNHSQTKMIEF